MLTCSRVIDIPVLSLALLQLVNLSPFIRRQICDDNWSMSVFFDIFACTLVFKVDIMSDNKLCFTNERPPVTSNKKKKNDHKIN